MTKQYRICLVAGAAGLGTLLGRIDELVGEELVVIEQISPISPEPLSIGAIPRQSTDEARLREMPLGVLPLGPAQGALPLGAPLVEQPESVPDIVRRGGRMGSIGSRGRSVRAPDSGRSRGVVKDIWEHDASLILLQSLRTGPCLVAELVSALVAEGYKENTAKARLADLTRIGVVSWELYDVLGGATRRYTLRTDPAELAPEELEKLRAHAASLVHR